MLAVLASLCLSGANVDPPKPYGEIPTVEQLNYHKEELSAFIHYGVNTYTGKEWGTGAEDPEIFQPTKLDTDQWVKVLKEAGFKRIVMIARHHDGFCLFNSQYTRHQINESRTFQETSKKLGQSGDVWTELSKSVTKYDMGLGVYLSPWDMNSSYYGHEEEYNRYYMNQLTELIGSGRYGNSGKFVEVWMDGAKGAGAADQKYYFMEWFALIEKLQPGCVVYSSYGTTARWIGNESGRSGDPCWSKLNKTRQRDYYDTTGGDDMPYLNRGDPEGDTWSVGECDVSLASGWFWTESSQPKSMEELTSIYFSSVAHGEPLLLNVPPTKEGRFGDNFVARIGEFGQTIKNSFRDNLAFLPGVKATASNVRGGSSQYAAENVLNDDETKYWTMDDDKTTGTLEIDLGKPMVFDTIMICEHIQLGQRIIHHTVEVRVNGQWQLWAKSSTIGAKRLLRDFPVTSDGVRITITESYAVPLITSVGLFKAYGAFSMGDGMPTGLVEVGYKDATRTGGWTEEEGAVSTSQKGASIECDFEGTKAFIVGTVDKDWGAINVFVDGVFIEKVSNKRPSHLQRQLLWKSADFANGKHKMKIECAGEGKIAVRSFYFLSNDGQGMFEIASDKYSVNRGDDVTLTIKRVGGSTGEAKVTFMTAPDSAMHGVDYIAKTKEITFANGEDTKTVSVETIKRPDKPGNLAFLGKIGSPTGKAIVGFVDKSVVTIIDNSAFEKRVVGRRQIIELIQ